MIDWGWKGLEMVVSGGQTGADHGGLAAAYDSGIKTFGIAPKGYRTLAGPNPELGTKYGLVESTTSNYAVRTEDNVKLADATIRIASNFTSPGELCTLKAIKKHKSKYLDVRVPISKKDDIIPKIAEWLRDNNVKVLNVAGNGDRTGNFHYQATYDILMDVFAYIKEHIVNDTAERK
ncbi:MAG: putative molybdenum carrier protein [Candidatus Nitrosotenuis sp.]